MQKRKPVHILTFAAAVALSASIALSAQADSSSALDNMWNDQSKSSNANSQSVPPDTTPSLAPDQPGTDMGTTPDTTAPGSAPAPDAPLSSAPVPDAGTGAHSAPAPVSAPTPDAINTTMPDTSSGAAPSSERDLVAPAVPVTASGERNPLCSIDDFTQSDLVQYSSWPGVGPFRGAAPNFSDPNQNKITVDISSGKVTGAQLSVADAPSDLLKLQMSADFLLESVGAKPGKIASFNEQLEKARPQLATSTGSDPINLTAGSYLVCIYPANQTADSLNYIIRINSKDATRDVIKHSVPSALSSPKVDGANPDTTTIAMVNPDEAATAKNSEALKNEFVELINKWQSVKRTAVRARDASVLSAVLSGRALQQQSTAIKWLSDNHKYYLMSPGRVSVDHYQEIVKDQKYAVYAQVSETKKYMDDATDEMLKDTSSTYNVKYTVEKAGDHWLINDSEVLNAPPQVKASR